MAWSKPATGGTGGGTGLQGPAGPPGPQGPPGSSSTVFEYSLNTSNAFPPGNTKISSDATAQASTSLHISYFPVGTVGSYAPLLRNITTGDSLLLQDKTDSTKYVKWIVTSDSMDHPATECVEVQIAYVEGTAIGKNNQNVLLFHQMKGAPGPAGPAGPAGPKGDPGTGGGGGAVPELKELTNTTALAANETKVVTLATGYDKYDLRTIRANATNAAAIVVTVMDKPSGGQAVYKSLQSASIYDVVTVPITDKLAAQSIYVELKNTSSSATSVTSTFNITSLT